MSMWVIPLKPGEYDYSKDLCNMDVYLDDDGGNTEYSIYQFDRHPNGTGAILIHEIPDMDEVDAHNTNLLVKYCLDIERDTEIFLQEKDEYYEWDDLRPRKVLFHGTVRFDPVYDIAHKDNWAFRVYTFKIIEEKKNV